MNLDKSINDHFNFEDKCPYVWVICNTIVKTQKNNEVLKTKLFDF